MTKARPSARPFPPLPILLLRRGEVRPQHIESLLDDERFEVFMVRRISPAWRSIANHVSATLIATNRDPLDALTYALTAGVAGPIVMLLPRRLLRYEDDVIAAGAAGCVGLPVDQAGRDHLVRLLRHRTGLAMIDPTLRLLMDPISRTVRHRRRIVELSQREFALLYCLSSQSGRAVSADELLQRVWQDARLKSRQRLDVYIYQLRRKLGLLGLARPIATIRGYGYALGAPEARRAKRARRAATKRKSAKSRRR